MAGRHRMAPKHTLRPDRTPVKPRRVADYLLTHDSHYDNGWPGVPFRAGVFLVVIAVLGIAATGVRVVPPDPPETVTVASIVQADVPTPGLCEVTR